MGKKALPLLFFLLTAIFWFGSTQSVSALDRRYFDYGPYYGPQVLGLSFSSLENLPVPSIPPNVIPPKATGILPDSPFAPLKTFVENSQLTFTFDPVKKEELRLQFAQERLSAANTLMEAGKFEAAGQAMDDYNQLLKEVTNSLSNLTDKNDPAAQNLATRLENSIDSQSVFATYKTFTSSPVQAENWNSVVRSTQKALDEIAQSKGEPAVPEDLSLEIQKLKENGQISEEESNKIYGLASRGDVREELNKLAFSNQFPASELAKLDTTIARNYPDFQKTLETNMEVAELRMYQTLPQPPDKIIAEIEKWQDDPSTPPGNDIKPYLWYNRAADLAKNVDLSNFPQEQQTEVAKLYPQEIKDNPTYSPPPSPSASPTPSATPKSTDESTEVSPSPSPSVAPTAAPKQTGSYIQPNGGALPGEPAYILKRFGEDFSVFVNLDPSEKARLRMQHAENRLAEARALSEDPKKAADYENALKDYRSDMSEASNYIKGNIDENSKKDLAERLETQAARHEVVMEKGLLPAPKDPKVLAEAIKATEDALDRSADALGRPSLPIGLVDRIEDLKGEGLILPEEAAELVRSDSREKARENVRKLVDLGSFPPADSKKLDEAQVLNSTSDFNQLVEVRKVEELQRLRAVQSEFAQTPKYKANVQNLAQREEALNTTIDTSLIKKEDLGGRKDLIEAFEKLNASSRPVNGGQFGGVSEPTPSASPSPTASPRSSDAVLTTCPAGAIFKQFEGCVWADSGKSLDDYEQYRCDGPRQYFSFASRKCVAYDSDTGFGDDARPLCPVGYSWSWETQSCQTSTGGTIVLPTPKPEPGIDDEKEIEERSKSCPVGSSYKPPKGCVWDDNGKTIQDGSSYRCNRTGGEYYSFEQRKCVSYPKKGEPFPNDGMPKCKESGQYWDWSNGKCDDLKQPVVVEPVTSVIDTVKPTLAVPGSPLYPLKQLGENIRLAVAFTPEDKANVRISQARERLAEGLAELEKQDEKAFADALSAYTAKMQDVFNDLSKSNLSADAKKAISEKLVKESTDQNLILQKIEAVADSDQASVISAASSSVILGVDKAADIAGEPPIPSDLKEKIDALPAEMISEDDKKKLLEVNTRVDARVKLGELAAKGGLDQSDIIFLNEDFENVDKTVSWKLEELKKLEEIATVSEQKKEIEQKVEKNEEIVGKLTEFQKNFEPGKDVPAEIRPYVRLTRIEEVANTIRPDIVRLEDFQNRKDVVLAVATLKEEFKPTKEAIQKVEEFRRKNPNAALPLELARIEALSYGLGVRNTAGPCFLPTPPFPANTPCPPPGAAIPVNSYAVGSRFVELYSPVQEDGGSSWFGRGAGAGGWQASSVDKDGKPLVYGQGPAPVNSGVCPNGYHWMYDSGGWCMSNSGSYGNTSSNVYTPTGPTNSNYTPYSPYYSAPGAPSSSYSYPVGDNSTNDGCPYGYDSDGRGNCVRNSYPSSSYSYGAPNYYGVAPTYYTTTPPSGTVPGSGPQPTSPGQCPTGYHWMSDSGGWCMSNGNTYVPPGGYGTSAYPNYAPGTTTSSTPPPGGYNCGSQSYDPATGRCRDGACPGGFNWNGSSCVAAPTYSSSGGGSGYNYNYSPSSYSYGCTPGYYWDGSRCVAGSYEGSGWSDSGARSGTYCQPPSSGCGSSSYWDYGSCSCRSNTYYGGGSYTSNSCQGISCGSGTYLDYSTCSCRSSTSSTGTSGSTGTSTTGSCPAGSHWMSDNGGWCMSDSGSGGSTSTSGTSSSTSSGGSCPSGYHWMSDNGGWCMSDGGSGGSTSTSTSSSPAPTSAPAASSEPAPAPASSAPAPASSEPAPAPASSEPAPAPSP